jgi:hypothetical protein
MPDRPTAATTASAHEPFFGASRMGSAATGRVPAEKEHDDGDRGLLKGYNGIMSNAGHNDNSYGWTASPLTLEPCGLTGAMRYKPYRSRRSGASRRRCTESGDVSESVSSSELSEAETQGQPATMAQSPCTTAGTCSSARLCQARGEPESGKMLSLRLGALKEVDKPALLDLNCSQLRSVDSSDSTERYSTGTQGALSRSASGSDASQFDKRELEASELLCSLKRSL